MMYLMKFAARKKITSLIHGLIVVIASIFGILYFWNSFASTSTDTTLWIVAGAFNFFKDTGTTMDSYFSHGANTGASIDIWSYAASLSAISAASSSNHRFTVSDMLGSSFVITLQSSALTASGVTSIPASAVSYTGTDWLWTGMALTATGTQNTPLNTPVTFVARANASWLSLYSQEITLKVQVPAAQAPASYTGQLTFTY